MNARRGLLRLAGGAVLLGALPRAARAKPVRVHTGPAFGSAWRLVVPDTREAAAARIRVEQIVARIDASMSPFREGSDVARFNAAGVATVSGETSMVVRAALELAIDSGGAFDPTAAPLSRRYGVGPVASSPPRPAARHRDIRIAGRVLRTSCAGLSLDLCGIAKGRALDAIAGELDGLDFLVELGGEIIARGRHPSGRAWRVGIERPGSDQLQRVIEPGDRALATSGDAAQGYLVGARQYAHVVDPRSGAPVASGVASVSVLAPTGLAADGLSTAAMVLGPQAARALLAAHGASALFLMRHAGGLEEVAVNGFATERAS